MRKDFEDAINEAKAAGRFVSFSFKGAIELAESYLLENETVKYVMGANIGVITAREAMSVKPFNIKNKTAGILVITTNRIFHCAQVLFNKKFEQILFSDINNIESKSTLIASVLRIQSLTNTMEIDIASKNVTEVTKLVQELKNQASSPQPQQQPQGSGISQADELAKFKKLFDDGILTAEEFEKKKAQILGL